MNKKNRDNGRLQSKKHHHELLKFYRSSYLPTASEDRESG